MSGLTVNVLGQEYEIILRTQATDKKLEDANGYTETYSKKIVLDDFNPDEMSLELPDKYKAKVLRHEIVHAFLHESGLDSNSEWARNEEIVDWIALQGKKIYAAWEAAGAV